MCNTIEWLRSGTQDPRQLFPSHKHHSLYITNRIGCTAVGVTQVAREEEQMATSATAIIPPPLPLILMGRLVRELNYALIILHATGMEILGIRMLFAKNNHNSPL